MRFVAFAFLALWVLFAFGGLALMTWAKRSLPAGTPMTATPPVQRVQAGAYRWLRHPMYLGNTLFITGVAGMGGGALVALALFSLSVTVFGEWAAREDA